MPPARNRQRAPNPVGTYSRVPRDQSRKDTFFVDFDHHDALTIMAFPFPRRPMASPPPSELLVSSDILRFRCDHCFQALQVPAAYSGQSAPCPFCLEITTAPAPLAQSAVQSAPQASVSAPLRFPCPSCHQFLMVPAELAGISGPCCFCGTCITAPSNSPSRSPVPEQEPPAARQERRLQRPPQPQLQVENGSGREKRLRRITKRRRMPEARGRSRGILGAAGIAVLTFSVAAATVFLAGPGKRLLQAGTNGADSASVYESAMAHRERLENSKNQAIKESLACVQKFLAATNWREASQYAVGIPQPALGRQAVPIANADPENVRFLAAERQPGTEKFTVLHRLRRDGEHPEAIIRVEETPEGPRIRWDLLEQQLSGRMRRFQSSARAPATRFYARVEAISSQENPFPENPDLANAFLVGVSSAFSPAESEPFYAVAIAGSQAESALAGLLATAHHVSGWIAASRTTGHSGINYIAISAFHPDTQTWEPAAEQQNRALPVLYGNSGVLR